jgi:peptidoglycan/LPS O-acetylase OafA/YrhL
VTAATKPLGYQPSLDGVRAIAVIAVMTYHAGMTHVRGGYLGVDVFFVLSGFLITSLLVTEFGRDGHIKLSRFYTRRLRRLLPAVLVMLAFVAVYVQRFPHEKYSIGVHRDVVGTLLYVANWVAVAHSRVDQGFNMLAHTWSLSIEEQFYFVWPLALFLLLRARAPRALVVGLTGGGYVVACVERVVLLHRAGRVTPWLFFSTDARGGTLLLGCFLGLVISWGLVPQWTKRFAVPATFIGLAALAYAFISVRYAFAPHRAFTEGLGLIGVSTALVIFGVVTSPNNVAARLLALPPVVWIGKVSYGLYLWHLPIFVIIRQDNHDLGLNTWQIHIVQFAVTLAIVTASYYVIEQPIRHGWRPSLGRRR